MQYFFKSIIGNFMFLVIIFYNYNFLYYTFQDDNGCIKRVQSSDSFKLPQHVQNYLAKHSQQIFLCNNVLMCLAQGLKDKYIFNYHQLYKIKTFLYFHRYNIHLLNSAINRTNILYGALNLQVTNVVFIHGSIDPWHVLGLTKSSNPQMPVIYINGA